jgi:ribosomal protein S18 acetylase RimI-like enzyme
LNEALDTAEVSVVGIPTTPPGTIRKVQPSDREHIRTTLGETAVFKQEEIDVAMELVDIVLEKPDQQDYEMYCWVDEMDMAVGFLCIGPTPITKGTFDLYWIAVRPAAQRRGVGKRLLSFGEELVRSKNGRLLVAETSSQPSYLPSRTFYLNNGFSEVARIPDYYDRGDDLMIYVKYLQ